MSKREAERLSPNAAFEPQISQIFVGREPFARGTEAPHLKKTFISVNLRNLRLNNRGVRAKRRTQKSSGLRSSSKSNSSPTTTLASMRVYPSSTPWRGALGSGKKSAHSECSTRGYSPEAIIGNSSTRFAKTAAVFPTANRATMSHLQANFPA